MRFFPLLLLPFAACSGGGSSDTGTGNTNTAGSVYVVVDTATGSEALVQFQVAAALLERSDGTTTTNLLASPDLITFADPSGEVDGLRLVNVPTGDYDQLHLMLVPGSGAVLESDGSVLPIQSVVDLSVPIADGLQHSAQTTSWLAVGHNGSPPPVQGIDPMAWTPVMTARADGSSHEVSGLRVARVQPAAVTVTLGCVDDGVLQVEFAPDCSFDDDGGDALASRDDFLRSLTRDDDLRVLGELRRDGRCLVHHARRGRGNDGPRLLGRITELRPATSSFLLDVQAEVRRGERRLLSPRVTVLVLAAEARIHRPDSRITLAFGELQVGNLAKVKWTSRMPVAGGPDEVVAREIEVVAAGVPMQPEWQGRVQSVSLATNTIVVVPRHDDPIVIAGVSVAQATVEVDANTTIQRRERHGGGHLVIELPDIVPDQDRIWWRGRVTGPTTIDANQVRVREE